MTSGKNSTRSPDPAFVKTYAGDSPRKSSQRGGLAVRLVDGVRAVTVDVVLRQDREPGLHLRRHLPAVQRSHGRVDAELADLGRLLRDQRLHAAGPPRRV